MSEQLDALKQYIDWFGEIHENCPGDDTCECVGKYVNENIGMLLTSPRYTTLRDMIMNYLKPLGDVEVERNTFYSRVARADSIITALYAVMRELNMPEVSQLTSLRIKEKKN